jgi:guanylate kinase
VLSSPSGAGKTTLARRLLARDREIAMSVSVTTRPPRRGEVDGADYHFIAQDRFRAMVDQAELLEWAEVFGHHYGTPREPVETALAEGRDMLFDIDWQGTQQLGQVMAEDLVRIFILPPSAEALRQRLIERAQDPMADAAKEISHWPEYDYVIVNSELAASDRAIDAILTAERLKRQRRTGLTAFVRGLLSEL